MLPAGKGPDFSSGQPYSPSGRLAMRRDSPHPAARVRVRYLYDPQAGRRLKTVELIVESITRRDAKRLDIRIESNSPDAHSPYAGIYAHPSLYRCMHPEMHLASPGCRSITS